MTTKLEKTLYTRVTEQDFHVLSQVAEQRQQSISQLIRKILIDSGTLNR
jgi:DNA-binding MarR family transcriptional regulator